MKADPSGKTRGTSLDPSSEALLTAITPLDGRYRERLDGLELAVSEASLIGYRLRVEAHWLLHLASNPAVARELGQESRPPLADTVRRRLETIAQGEDLLASAHRVKELERTTNHDVKAVEYCLREELSAVGADSRLLAYIHFACTSEDVNNLAYALMLEEVRRRRILPLQDRVILDLAEKAKLYAATPMLSRTHGQSATPTTLGKELAVFARRLKKLRDELAEAPNEGKINGAVGNYNAHVAAFPEVAWPELARAFVEERLKLTFNPLTTQIENHDSLVRMTRVVSHFNTISIGLCRDIWGYVSLGYFTQKTKAGEIGSSTMPHKVNPIDFENAEGNFGVASALGNHFADKLPISRWQRDLSDSTVLRSLGTFFGHTELAYRSLLKGLGKVEANAARIDQDLDQAWEVLAEAVQTVMRRYGVVDAYERLKEATRGKAQVSRNDLLGLVQGCKEVPDAAKAELAKLTPRTYLGVAEKLARDCAAELGVKG